MITDTHKTDAYCFILFLLYFVMFWTKDIVLGSYEIKVPLVLSFSTSSSLECIGSHQFSSNCYGLSPEFVLVNLKYIYFLFHISELLEVVCLFIFSYYKS